MMMIPGAQVDIKRAAMEEPSREVVARIYVYSQSRSREYTYTARVGTTCTHSARVD